MTGQVVTMQDNSYVTEVIVDKNTPMFLQLLFVVSFPARCQYFRLCGIDQGMVGEQRIVQDLESRVVTGTFLEGVKETTNIPSHDV